MYGLKGSKSRVDRVWGDSGGEGWVGVKNFFSIPKKLLILAYPENLVKIRLLSAG